MNKLVGLAFDRCSLMAGKENGVPKIIIIICNKYHKAIFFVLMFILLLFIFYLCTRVFLKILLRISSVDPFLKGL